MVESRRPKPLIRVRSPHSALLAYFRMCFSTLQQHTFKCKITGFYSVYYVNLARSKVKSQVVESSYYGLSATHMIFVKTVHKLNRAAACFGVGRRYNFIDFFLKLCYNNIIERGNVNMNFLLSMLMIGVLAPGALGLIELAIENYEDALIEKMEKEREDM